MAVEVSIDIRKINALTLVPIHYPSDWWSGEPMVPTGIVIECLQCGQRVDLCDACTLTRQDWPTAMTRCVECQMRANHPGTA